MMVYYDVLFLHLVPLDLPKIRVMPGMFDPSKVKLKPPPPSADPRFKPTKGNYCLLLKHNKL